MLVHPNQDELRRPGRSRLPPLPVPAAQDHLMETTSISTASSVRSHWVELKFQICETSWLNSRHRNKPFRAASNCSTTPPSRPLKPSVRMTTVQNLSKRIMTCENS